MLDEVADDLEHLRLHVHHLGVTTHLVRVHVDLDLAEAESHRGQRYVTVGETTLAHEGRGSLAARCSGELLTHAVLVPLLPRFHVTSADGCQCEGSSLRDFTAEVDG